jgi:hypothetical protein
MNHINEYVERGQISVRTTKVGDETYSITCYTKDQFFNHEWDYVTINHRGRIYRDDGICINNPFPKIFNLNEQPSTEETKILGLLKTEKYEVLDKLNGHLTIVSYDIERDNILVSTKGSFGGDLAIEDYKLADRLGILEAIKTNGLNVTFMFECIAEYDKHLWFEKQLDVYSKFEDDILVMIGAIDNETGESYTHDKLYEFASLMNVPVTRRYPELETGVLDELYDHKGIEGYVFHFPELNFRFKVKTKEYVTLHYMKEVNSDKIVNELCNSGLANMYLTHDEEIYPILDALKFDFCDFVEGLMVPILYKYSHLTKREVAELELDKIEKSFLFNDNKDPMTYMRSKSVRVMFKESGNFPNVDDAIENFFSKKLYSIGVTV